MSWLPIKEFNIFNSTLILLRFLYIFFKICKIRICVNTVSESAKPIIKISHKIYLNSY